MLTQKRCPGPAGPLLGEIVPLARFPGPRNPAPYMPRGVARAPRGLRPHAPRTICCRSQQRVVLNSPLSHRTLPRSMLCGSLRLHPPSSVLGCRPFSAENCPPDSFPGATNPQGAAASVAPSALPSPCPHQHSHPITSVRHCRIAGYRQLCSVAHWDFTGLHPPQAAAASVPLRVASPSGEWIAGLRDSVR